MPLENFVKIMDRVGSKIMSYMSVSLNSIFVPKLNVHIILISNVVW